MKWLCRVKKDCICFISLHSEIGQKEKFAFVSTSLIHNFFYVNLKSTHYSLTFLHLSPSAFYFFGFPACISFDSWSLNVIVRICCEKTVNSGTATDVVATSEGFIVRWKWMTMILASTNKSDSFTDNHFLWNLSWTLANRLTLFTDTTVTVIFIIFDWSVTINVLSRV